MFNDLVRPSDYIAWLLPRLHNRLLPLHSRFERSVNLTLGPSLLLTITSPALGLSPFGLAAHRDLGHLIPEIARADGLVYRNERFWAGGRPILELAPTPPYSTRLAPTARAPQHPAAEVHRLLEELSPAPRQGLAEMLSGWAPGQRLATLDTEAAPSPWVRQAAISIAPFAAATVPGLVQGARRLIGLGLGLTPSGDDFLLGFIAARSAQGATDEVRLLRHRLAHDSMQATNLISASYLRHGLQGRFSSHVKRLLDLLHAPGSNTCTVRQVMEQVIQVGSTSGRDSLIGVLAGLYRWEEQEGRVSP